MSGMPAPAKNDQADKITYERIDWGSCGFRDKSLCGNEPVAASVSAV